MLFARGVQFGRPLARRPAHLPSALRRCFGPRPPRLPTGGVTRPGQYVGLSVGVVDVVAHRQLTRRVFAKNRLRYRIGGPVHVAVADGDGLPRQSDQPLDVVLFRVARKLEHDHVPTLRIAQRITELVDDDAVAVERLFVRFVRQIQRVHETTVRTHPADDHLKVVQSRRLMRRADGEPMTARVAVQIFVSPHQRRCHRARRDHERLRQERAEDQRQDKSDHQRFDVFAATGNPKPRRPPLHRR